MTCSVLDEPAVFSEDGTCRFWLSRPTGDLLHSHDLIVFVGLNPSTADATKNDPTVRRCIGFARAWRYERVGVVNIFPLRSTDPKGLYDWDGSDSGTNDLFISAACDAADLVVAAWSGMVGDVRRRVPQAIVPDVPGWCRRYGTPLACFGLTKTGAPRHPLYLASSASLVEYPHRTVV